MKVSTKGRYALHLMIDVARNQESGPVSLKDISTRQNISMKYLEQIAGRMTKAGLLQSVRGAQGGYRLSRAPEEITAGHILRAGEGDLAPISCLLTGCDHSESCDVAGFWHGMYEALNTYTDSVTLKDLIG